MIAKKMIVIIAVIAETLKMSGLMERLQKNNCPR